MSGSHAQKRSLGTVSLLIARLLVCQPYNSKSVMVRLIICPSDSHFRLVFKSDIHAHTQTQTHELSLTPEGKEESISVTHKISMEPFEEKGEMY